MGLTPRFSVTSAQIEQVVTRFYAAVRDDPRIGPIFAAHVTDWPTHEAKIVQFWRNAILLERSYEGNPMRVHMAVEGLSPDHFEPWLDMFDRVLVDELPAPTAMAWSDLAHRIGRGLRFGLETYTNDSPPRFG